MFNRVRHYSRSAPHVLYLLVLFLTSSLPLQTPNKVLVQGNDGPKEPAGYYLVGGDAASYSPGSFELIQAGKSFAPKVLSAPIGSEISFPNRDSFIHNVYSPEGVMGFFDLGSANTTDANNSNLIKKEFSSEGSITISCAVHPIMKAHIFVIPSKYHTASEDGTYSFDGVPSGTYDLMVITGKEKAKKLKSITI